MRIDREMLIGLCERGAVQVSEWMNRDSADAQRQLGEARSLLRAGADWSLSEDPASDDRTIWVRLAYPGFGAFEHGREDRGNWENELFYIPTAARLHAANGRDWY